MSICGIGSTEDNIDALVPERDMEVGARNPDRAPSGYGSEGLRGEPGEGDIVVQARSQSIQSKKKRF